MTINRRQFTALSLLTLAGCGGGGGGVTPGINDNVLTSAPGARISIATSDGPLTVASIDSQAGAIGSLTWNGMEFINARDHGRLMQSASQFNGLGEDFNPTEAGSMADGLNPSPSSSQLLNRVVTPTSLSTDIRMAYWHAVSGGAISDHVHHKTVMLGALGNPNLIEYQVGFDIPDGQQYQATIFEVLTAYMPPNFSVVQAMDKDGTLSDLPFSPDGQMWEQPLPHVFSTPDGSYAMGAWSPGLPQPDFPLAGFGGMRLPEVVKWNVVRRFPSSQGKYQFTVYVAVGSKQTVVKSLLQAAQA